MLIPGTSCEQGCYSFVPGNHRFHRQRDHASSVADYRPSPEAQRRIAELIAQEKEGSLSVEEKSELDHFMDFGAHSPGSEGAGPTDPRQWLLM
jgi:hypothetical protein